jgi:hypothetical protein
MAPCWYGINLGKSSASNVYETLAELPFVNQNDIREWGTIWGDDDQAREIFYYCSYLPKQQCGGMTLSRGKVVRIWTQIDYSLTMESIVERIGSPDYRAMFPGIEFQHCEVVLVWIDNEAVISASNQRNPGCPSNTGIKADMQADTLTYSLENDPGFYERYDIYQKWSGFAMP